MIARDTHRAVRTFVTLLVIAGSASLALTMSVAWHRGLGDLRLLALAMAVLALMSVSPVVFEWKGEAGNVNLEEVFFAMLVMTSPPAAVIVAMIFGNLFTNVFNRRTLQQITFNVSLAGVVILYRASAMGVRAIVAVAGGLSLRGLAARMSATDLVILSSSAYLGVLTDYGKPSGNRPRPEHCASPRKRARWNVARVSRT